MQVETQKVEAARVKYLDAANALDKLPGTAEALANRAKLKTLSTTARRLNMQVLDLALAGSDKEASALLLGPADVATTAMQAAMEENMEMQRTAIAKANQEASAAARQAEWLLLILSISGLLLGTVVAWLTTRSIVAPLRRAVQVASTVAHGDLSSTIEASGRDETAELLLSLARMNASLARVVGTVRQGADSIATASVQISAANTDLSQRTEVQAANLEETATSMEEINATAQNAAATTAQAAQIAESAMAAASRGGEVIRQVISTMNEIDTSSQRIAEIIGVMDTIAFQTNILALNAAVEAARAGEQGRGFAVVAGEVRALAQRSAASAKEIKSLISASVDKVLTGTNLVSDAGTSMADIVVQVTRVNDLIAEVSMAAKEQTAGVGQISESVSHLDRTTQQNAALVEETAGASESLKRQAAQLKELMETFKLASSHV